MAARSDLRALSGVVYLLNDVARPRSDARTFEVPAADRVRALAPPLRCGGLRHPDRALAAAYRLDGRSSSTPPLLVLLAPYPYGLIKSSSWTR